MGIGGMNNDGINLLARELQNRMQTISEKPPLFDFGTIQSDFSLMLDHFPIPIPKADYLVCRHLTLGKKDEILTKTKAGQGNHGHGASGGHAQEGGSGVHSHPATEGAHVHDVLIPEKMASLKPNDRVLTVMVGNDAIVIDIIISAKGLK